MQNILFFSISLGHFWAPKKMKNVITWGSREVITIWLEVNLEKREGLVLLAFSILHRLSEYRFAVKAEEIGLFTFKHREVKHYDKFGLFFKRLPICSLCIFPLTVIYTSNQYSLNCIAYSTTEHKHEDKIRLSESPQSNLGLLCSISLCMALCHRHILMLIKHLKWPAPFRIRHKHMPALER